MPIFEYMIRHIIYFLILIFFSFYKSFALVFPPPACNQNMCIDLNALVFCKGQTVDLPVILNGFYIGDVFVELSDTSGSFNQSQILGGMYINYTGSYNIPCTFPANIIKGANYRLRLRASNAPDTSSPFGPVYIDTLPALKTNKNPILCSGDSVNISAYPFASGNPLKYVWIRNGSDTLPSDSLFSLKVKTDGNYYALLKVNHGCLLRTNDTVVNINPYPQVGLFIPRFFLCSNKQPFVLYDTTVFTAGTYTRKWTLNNIIIPTTSSSLFLSVTGFYGSRTVTLQLTTNAGCVAQASRTIYILQSPVAKVLTNDTMQCENEHSFVLNNTSTGVIPLSHSWMFDDSTSSALNNLSGKKFTSPGIHNFTYKVSSPNGCLDSVVKSLYIIPAKTAAINASKTNICEGDFALVTTEKEQGASYLWYKNGSIQTAFTDTFIHASLGTYQVRFTDSSGCLSSASPSLEIGTLPMPEKPTISRLGSRLFTNFQAYYQWYGNNMLLPGATKYFHDATFSGMYMVRVTNDSGCSSSSDLYPLANVGIDQIEKDEPTLFPNPTTGIFIFNYPKLNIATTLEIYTLTGELIKTEIIAHKTTAINLTEQPTGMYLVRFVSSDGNVWRRLLQKK